MTQPRILAPSDLCFVYFAIKELVDSYEDIVKSGKVISTIDIDEFNQITRVTHLTDDQLENITNQSDFVKAKSIIKKLESVVELIQESEPEIYKEVENIFNKRLNKDTSDDFEEEDEDM